MLKIILISILSTPYGESQLSQEFNSMETCVKFAELVLPTGNVTNQGEDRIYARQNSNKSHRIYCIRNE